MRPASWKDSVCPEFNRQLPWGCCRVYAKGQIIFTTHESCLLDQTIFRPDEIWFAQKDVDQSTQLYPLSDYNIHKTANIENGYLNGRYGGIPFLTNFIELQW